MIDIGYIEINDVREMPRKYNSNSASLQNDEMIEIVESLYDQPNTEVEFTCKFGRFGANISITEIGTSTKFILRNIHLLSKT